MAAVSSDQEQPEGHEDGRRAKGKAGTDHGPARRWDFIGVGVTLLPAGCIHANLLWRAAILLQRFHVNQINQRNCNSLPAYVHGICFSWFELCLDLCLTHQVWPGSPGMDGRGGSPGGMGVVALAGVCPRKETIAAVCS